MSSNTDLSNDLQQRIHQLVQRYRANAPIIDLMCQHGHTLVVMNYVLDSYQEKPSVLAIHDLWQMVESLWRRWWSFNPQRHRCSNENEVNARHWHRIGWKKFAAVEQVLGKIVTSTIQEALSSPEHRTRLTNLLSGYCLMVREEAPDCVVDEVFEMLRKTAWNTPVIDVELYDEAGLRMRKALAVDELMATLCDDMLVFVELFKTTDTGFIRRVRAMLSMVVAQLEL